MVEKMNQAESKRWPTSLTDEDYLYAIANDNTNLIEYLVFSSSEKGDTFVRDNGSWVSVSQTFFDELDSPEFYNKSVDLDFIGYFDAQEAAGNPIGVDEEPTAMTAAAEDACPVATQDIRVNLKNRKNAIDTAMYGPLNPDEPNEEYWSAIADEWGVSADEAKKQRCGNCTMFVITTKMKKCIEDGLTGGERSDEFDSIEAAGQLGYCEAFDFKCASARTCRAWVVGGPIADDIKSK